MNLSLEAAPASPPASCWRSRRRFTPGGKTEIPWLRQSAFRIFGGHPAGYGIELENGFRVYFMGDTGVFGDLRLIGETPKPDRVPIPVGGHFASLRLHRMIARCLVAVVAALCAGAALAEFPESRGEALKNLDDAAAEQRAHAVIWFAQNGGPADDKLLLPRLCDEDPVVRELAQQGMWVLWTRSGDKAVDALMARGAERMQARDFAASIATYSEVIRRKPAFAEGWNKRATVRFLAGDFKGSLADCDEVMKRNPYHFGALSGYGQIYFELKQYDKAIDYWQRALKVNPNLVSLNQNIELARQRLAETRRNSA